MPLRSIGKVIRASILAPNLALQVGIKAMLSDDPSIEVVSLAASFSDLREGIDDTDVLVIVWNGQILSKSNFDSIVNDRFAILFLVDRPGEMLSIVEGLHDRPWGILNLQCSAEELVIAVNALNNGLVIGTPEVFRSSRFFQNLEKDDSDQFPISETIGTLTDREKQVLHLIAQGYANKQIASDLHISEHTVKFHVSSVFSKLGAGSRTEAVRESLRRGLISL